MKTQLTVTGFFLLLISFQAHSQVSFTADDTVPAYDGPYLFGTNMGYYPSWDDMALANIAAGNPSLNIKGAGVRSFRPKLYEAFLETWGNDVRVPHFTHYSSLGIRDNTVFLDIGATDDHKDNTKYGGCDQESNLYKNMYEPIWDGGANGTPVNENNYYALFVYKTVLAYGFNTRFWEIINEPDFTYSPFGWRPRDLPGNWWESNPSPCDLQNMKAPIFHYIRVLRISYEVIKSLDPGAYVAPGGLGYPSFLDAMMRNSDNPVDGSLTSEFPKKAGAYFDCLSFHYYPLWDLRFQDPNSNVIYTRHSDAAVDGYLRRKNDMQAVLHHYGYDGTTYPVKTTICTETGVPRKRFEDFIGSEEAQRNYVMKTIIQSQKNEILQMYLFSLGESQDDASANDAFQTMGLFKNLVGKGPADNGGQYKQEYNNVGIAHKTISDILYSRKYDAARTAALKFPSAVDGGAFKDAQGRYTYVLWAKSTEDQSEAGGAVYSFPAAANVSPLLARKDWDYSRTGTELAVTSTNIPLSTTPSFLTEHEVSLPLDTTTRDRLRAEALPFKLFPNPAADRVSIQLTLKVKARVALRFYDAIGRVVYEGQNDFVKGPHTLEIPLPEGLSSGVYNYRIDAGNMSRSGKFLISR